LYELIPLLAGAATGYLSRSAGLVVALVAIVAVALVAGSLASTISGELKISAEFLLWDIGQGVVAGVAVRVLARRLEQRTA
jgi:hypothetical protein